MAEAKRSRSRREILASGQRCIYCAEPAKTVEHMPAVTMFKNDQRPNGMEYPACQACNRGTGPADLVASFLSRLDRQEIQFGREWQIKEAKNRRRLLNKYAPGVLEEFDDPTRRGSTYMPESFGMVRKVTINMNGPRSTAYMKVFAAKMGMALYAEHVGEPLPLTGGVASAYFLNIGMTNATIKGIISKMPLGGTLSQGRVVVRDQFQYRYNCDNRSIVAGLIGFHGNLTVFTIASSQPEFYGLPTNGADMTFFRPGELIATLPARP